MADTLQTLSVYYDESFVNNQEAGSFKKQNFHRKQREHIELKSSKKRYLVRVDDQKSKKYILINTKKVHLHSIPGQFRYVNG